VLIVLFLAITNGAFSASLAAGETSDLTGAFLRGALIGAVLSALAAGLTYFLGSGILSLICDAHKIAYHDDPVLFNIVEEMALAAGTPMPTIYVIFDESPNAFATGRDPEHAAIGITTGLRKKLNREELQAVIAHEMAHITNRDTLLMMLVGVFAGLIVLLSDFFVRRVLDTLTFRGLQKGKVKRAKPLHFWGFLGAIAGAALLAWIAPVIAKILQLAVSREREFLADATAVQYCRNPLALASALKKIAMDPDILVCDNRATEHMFIINPSPKRKLTNSGHESIWSTHPPVVKRIARLRKLAGEIGLQDHSKKIPTPSDQRV
jgi:heat shock protein HtpX